MIRTTSAPKAETIWAALTLAREDGLSAGEVADQGLAAEPYARRALRTWAKAGYLTAIPPATRERGDAIVYIMNSGAPKTPPILTASGDVAPREAAMSPATFAVIRRRAGLTLHAMASALGWNGSQATRSKAMKRFETGARPIDANLAAKIEALVKPPAA